MPAVSFTPDGKLLASIGVRDRALCLWDAETLQLLQHIQVGTYGVSASFSPDGKVPMAVCDGTIGLWRVDDRRLVEAASFKLKQTLDQVVWSPDGTRVAGVSYDHVIRLFEWSGKELKVVWESKPQNSAATAAVFIREGKQLATSHNDKTLRIWDIAKPEPTLVKSVQLNHIGNPRGLSVSADGGYLALAGPELRLWRIMPPGLEPIAAAAIPSNVNAVQAACWLGTQRTLVARCHHRVYVLDVEGEKVRQTADWDIGSSGVMCFTSTSDGAALAGGFYNGSVRIWNLESKGLDVGSTGLKERNPLDSLFTDVLSLVWRPDGTGMAHGGEDGAIHEWDLTGATPRHVRRYQANAGAANALAWSPSGKQFAASSAPLLHIWEAGADKPHAAFGPFKSFVQSLTVSPDGSMFMGGWMDGRVRFFRGDTAAHQVDMDIEFKQQSLPCVAWSPDSARVAIASQLASEVQVWKLASDKPQLETTITVTSPLWTSFSPDGRLLATTGQSGWVRLYDATRPSAGEPVFEFHMHGAQFFRSLDFSPDGRWLAALRHEPGAAYAHHVVVWDLVNRRVEQEWPWPGLPYHLRFAPDGRHLAVGNSNGSIYLLRFVPDELRSWREKVADLPIDNQRDAVLRKLEERNPHFDGTKKGEHIEDGKIVHFNLYSDQLTDLSPLRGFPHLRNVECQGRKNGSGKLKDLSTLRGLRLSGLNCGYNPEIADLTPLAKMPLNVVALSYTKVHDLSPLRGMNIATLYVRGCPISDLDPVRGMPMSYLDISETKVKDLSPIQDLPLVEIHLDDPKQHADVLRKIKTLSEINGMPAAQALK